MNFVRFHVSSCLAVLLLLAGCGEDGHSAADTTDSFTAAADALSARLDAAVKQGQFPRAEDPAVKGFENETARAIQALGTPALPVEGFDSFEKLCGKTATIVGSYVNIGVAQAPEAEKAAVMNRNAEQHLDQIFTPMLFSAHCSAAHMPFLQKAAGEDVAGKAAALGQVRAGAYGQAGGLLQMAAAADLDEARRRRIVDLLAEDADGFAIVLSPAQRQELAQASEAARASLPEALRGQIDKIKAGFTAAPCEALCRM